MERRILLEIFKPKATKILDVNNPVPSQITVIFDSRTKAAGVSRKVCLKPRSFSDLERGVLAQNLGTQFMLDEMGEMVYS